MLSKMSALHGCELAWSGNKYSPVRCGVCEWRAPMFDAKRWLDRGAAFPRCSGSPDEAQRAFGKVRAWIRSYGAKARARNQRPRMHEWRCTQYTAYCVRCGLYMHKVQTQGGAWSKDNCGNVTPLWNRVMKDIQANGFTVEVRERMYDGEAI